MNSNKNKVVHLFPSEKTSSNVTNSCVPHVREAVLNYELNESIELKQEELAGKDVGIILKKTLNVSIKR